MTYALEHLNQSHPLWHELNENPENTHGYLSPENGGGVFAHQVRYFLEGENGALTWNT